MDNRKLSGRPYISLNILEILNGCILCIIIMIRIIIIGPINSKLKEFVKVNELFLTVINN